MCMCYLRYFAAVGMTQTLLSRRTLSATEITDYGKVVLVLPTCGSKMLSITICSDYFSMLLFSDVNLNILKYNIARRLVVENLIKKLVTSYILLTASWNSYTSNNVMRNKLK